MRVKLIAGLVAGLTTGAALALSAISVSWAGPYVSQGPFVSPIPGDGVPGPSNVPGKEYVDTPNKDDTGAPSALQSLAWDGVGGTVNSFNWSGTFTFPAGVPVSDPARQVDAMAHSADALFKSVVADTSALLLSATGDPLAPVHYERRGAPGCGAGPCPVWATVAQVDGLGVTDLDGLEVWGPETPDGVGQDDTSRISLLGDPLGVSVWACGAPGPCIARVVTVAVAVAIGLPTPLIQQLDLDALMFFENGDAGEMLFSIRPIVDPAGVTIFDGGEIWYWDMSSPLATFLVHGGHVWDTAHAVAPLLGNENVDALEAVATVVPEPSSVALLGLGLLGLAPLVRRRKRN